MRVCLSPGGPSLYRSDEPANDVLVATMQGVIALVRPQPGLAWRIAGRALEKAWVDALLAEPGGAVLAGTFGDSIFASMDNGVTWEPRGRGIEFQEIYALNAALVNGRTRLYAGTQPAHLYTSDDGGAHWEEMVSLQAVPGIEKWWFPGEPHLAHVK